MPDIEVDLEIIGVVIALLSLVLGSVLAFDEARKPILRALGLSSETLSINLSESNHEVYFNIPGADNNDYPTNGRSVVQLGVNLTVGTSSATALNQAHLYLYRNQPQTLVKAFDSGQAASVSALGSAISREMDEWASRNQSFIRCDIPAGKTLQIKVFKYALVDSNKFHKDGSPFHACLVLNIGVKFYRFFLQLPLSGTGHPRISGKWEELRELQESSIATFCASQINENPPWQSSIDIGPKS